VATTTVCDVCRKAPALGAVRVSIEIDGAVLGTRVTGRLEQLDACQECRESAVEQSYQKARSTLLKHIPAQGELLGLNERLRALRTERTEQSNAAGALEVEIGSQLRRVQELQARKAPEAQLEGAREALERLREDHRGRLAAVEQVSEQIEPVEKRRNALRVETSSV